jgi:hypothetical protein
MNEAKLNFEKMQLIEVWGDKIFLYNDKGISPEDIGVDIFNNMLSVGFKSGKKYNVKFIATFEEVND